MAVILYSISLTAPADAAESRLRFVAQPGYWEPNIVTFPTLGMEAEVHLRGTPWSIGGVYTRYFSRYRRIPGPMESETNDFITRWEAPPGAQTLFARYTTSSTFSWLMGVGMFRNAVSATPPLDGVSPTSGPWQGPGVVLGLTYRPSLGPAWLQLAPNIVFSEYMWANGASGTQRLSSVVAYSASGLSWLELGLRLHPNVDFAIDPLTRTVRTSWVF